MGTLIPLWLRLQLRELSCLLDDNIPIPIVVQIFLPASITNHLFTVCYHGSHGHNSDVWSD
uniref:Uncharacterized protein n=1 Tax=Arundo donax TaxID=35708 RepID=A0A0A9GM13_ARUDO